MINEFKKYYMFLESDILIDYIKSILKNQYARYCSVDYVWFEDDVVKLDIGIEYYGDNEEETVIISDEKFDELLKKYMEGEII